MAASKAFAHSIEYAVGAATPFTLYRHMDVKVVGATRQFLHRDNLASVNCLRGGMPIKWWPLSLLKPQTA